MISLEMNFAKMESTSVILYSLKIIFSIDLQKI